MKKNTSIYLLSLLLSVVNAIPVMGLDITGDFEYDFGYNRNKNNLLNPANILGLQDYVNRAEFKASLSSGTKNSMMIDARGRYSMADKESTFFLDQAYINLEPGDILKFRFGRQRIGFGTGYLWNPVNDLDIRKDVYELSRYTRGVDGIKAVLDFTPRTIFPFSFCFEVLPPEDTSGKVRLSGSRFGAQFYTLLGGVEFGLAGSYKKEQAREKDTLYGFYSSVDIAGFIAGLECAGSKKPDLNYFSESGIFQKNRYDTQAVVSINKRLGESGLVVLEYFYNGFGFSNKEFDNMVHLLWMSYADFSPLIIGTVSPGYVSRNYFFASFSSDIVSNLSLTLSGMANLDRKGGFLYPRIAWTEIESITVTLESIVNLFSHTRSEFSLLPYDYTVSFRVQYFY
ncbi:MAG: hypothetical protein PHF84_11775 [bacterium]|nr:hypothetical protein [bacterium]